MGKGGIWRVRSREIIVPQPALPAKPMVGCLYPFPITEDPWAPLYGELDIPSSIDDNGTTRFRDDGAFSYDGGFIIAGDTQWERNGVGYGQYLIAGAIKTFFASSYLITHVSGASRVVLKINDCLYQSTDACGGVWRLFYRSTSFYTWDVSGFIYPDGGCTHFIPIGGTKDDADDSTPVGIYSIGEITVS